MTWLRWEAAYDGHPQVVAAGWQGGYVFAAVCRIAKLHGSRDGKLSAPYIAPVYLARVTGAPIDVIEAGLEGCTRAGLLVETAAGGATIPGWKRYQPDPTVADRVRRHREKQAEECNPEDVTVTPVSNGNGTDETVLYVTDGTKSTAQTAPPSAGKPAHRPRGLQVSPSPEELTIEREQLLTAWGAIRPEVETSAHLLDLRADGAPKAGGGCSLSVALTYLRVLEAARTEHADWDQPRWRHALAAPLGGSPPWRPEGLARYVLSAAARARPNGRPAAPAPGEGLHKWENMPEIIMGDGRRIRV